MANFIKNWTIKEIEVLAQSYKRYSFVVNLLKYLLPVVVIFLVLSMFVFSESTDTGASISIEPAKSDGKRSVSPIMVNPRFHGVDSRNQPYNIFAKSAFQESKDKVTLSEVSADITTNKDSWVSLVGDSGNYFIDKEFLELYGEVNIFVTEADFSGYEINTSEARVDVKNRLAYGENKVHVKSDIGDFTATGFEIEMKKEKITFTGPVKLIVYRK